MPRDRLSVSIGYVDTMDEMKKKPMNILDGLENKDIFLLCVAAGFESPEAISKYYGGGYVRYENLLIKERTLMSSLLLANKDCDLEKAVDMDEITRFCEQCSESGYKKLVEKFEDCDYNNEMFEEDILKDMDYLYYKYFHV